MTCSLSRTQWISMFSRHSIHRPTSVCSVQYWGGHKLCSSLPHTHWCPPQVTDRHNVRKQLKAVETSLLSFCFTKIIFFLLDLCGFPECTHIASLLTHLFALCVSPQLPSSVWVPADQQPAVNHQSTRSTGCWVSWLIVTAQSFSRLKRGCHLI